MKSHNSKSRYKQVKSLFGKYDKIPEEWEIKTFAELFEFLRTGTNPRSDLRENGDIQYIHYGDIHTKWNSVLNCDLETIPFIDKDKVEGLPLLKDGDLIIADASEDYSGSGSSVILNNVNDKKIVSGLHTLALRTIDNNILSNFKTYLTSIKFVKNQIIAYVTGISVYGLSKNNLKKIRIILPTLPEQQKIASILSNVDSLISQTQKEIEQTQILKKGLMQKLLTKGIGHTKFKKIDFLPRHISYEIPMEWKTTIMEKILIGNPQNGINIKLENYGIGVPIFEIDSLYNSEFTINQSNLRLAPIEDEIELKKYVLKENDFVINRVSKVKEGVGKMLLVLKPIKNLIYEGNMIRIKINEELMIPTFLEWLSKTDLYLRYIQSTCKTTSLTSIDQGIIAKIPILIPSKKEQIQIVQILENVDSQIQKQQEYKSKLEKLKKGLMQKLLTGQIRVKI